jgi:hypothetical protein
MNCGMVFRQGVTAGVIGFVTVVVFFVAVDAFAGREVFYTPALLGGALCCGVTTPADVAVAPAPVLIYSAAHLIVFVVLGLLAATFAALASRHRFVWFLVMNLFLVVIVHASGFVMTLTESLQGVVSAWLVTGATAAAAGAMAAYLISVSGPLRRELREPEFREP